MARRTRSYALSVGAGVAIPSTRPSCSWCMSRACERCRRWRRCLRTRVRGSPIPRFEVNFLRLLHGEQNLTVHQPLPASGEIEATYRVPAVVDKGEGKGALVYFDKQLRTAGGGELLCTVSSTPFLRADGGGGSFGTRPEALPGVSASPRVEFSDELATPLNSASLDRLNGDLNPIHADPVSAHKAGFERPILARSAHLRCGRYTCWSRTAPSADTIQRGSSRLAPASALLCTPARPSASKAAGSAGPCISRPPSRTANGRPEPGLRAHRLSAVGCASLRVASDRYGSVPSLLSPALAGAPVRRSDDPQNAVQR